MGNDSTSRPSGQGVQGFRIHSVVSELIRAHFWAAQAAQKPGFPLQVLGFANANPVGFPLQSLARAAAATRKKSNR
jgi:hypothetical protein